MKRMGQLKRTGNVFLIGLMGAGKTTVGRALARRLGRAFFDSDHEIEARTGVRVPIIFEHEGEEGFRNRESEVIDDLTQRDGIVLATGGGAVLRPENRAWLMARGQVVYLCAHPHDLWLRTRRDKNRPLLQTEDPRGRLEALYAVRDPIYRETAHFIVETGRPSISSLTHTVMTLLGLDAEEQEMHRLHAPSSPVGAEADGDGVTASERDANEEGRTVAPVERRPGAEGGADAAHTSSATDTTHSADTSSTADAANPAVEPSNVAHSDASPAHPHHTLPATAGSDPVDR